MVLPPAVVRTGRMEAKRPPAASALTLRISSWGVRNGENRSDAAERIRSEVDRRRALCGHWLHQRTSALDRTRTWSATLSRAVLVWSRFRGTRIRLPRMSDAWLRIHETDDQKRQTEF